uniref:Uncharacterized protein n=1 Tax=Eutreptiella gymnastica TaxID=73025 RepID=A0A7S1NTM7_9EUGL
MHNPGDASQTQILFAKHQCIHSQFCNWRSLWACHDGPTPEGPGEACKILEQGNGLGRIIDGHLICPAQVDPAHLLLLPPYAPIHLEVSVLFSFQLQLLGFLFQLQMHSRSVGGIL